MRFGPKDRDPGALTTGCGHLERFTLGCVEGWAPAPLDGGLPVVEVRIDKRVRVEAPATLERHDLLSRSGIRFGYGFQIELPPEVQDGASHVISARLAGSSTVFPGGPLRLAVPSLASGRIIPLVSSILRGWLPKKAALDGAFVLTVTVDDEPYRLLATPELGSLGEPIPEACSWRWFQAPLPPRIFDGSFHSIRVSAAGVEGIEGQPLVFQSAYVGSLDSCNNGLIQGWASDRSRPGEPLLIDLFENGSFLSTVSADGFRSDLHSAGLTNHAFSFPFIRADGGDSVVRARIHDQPVELPRSPLICTNGAALSSILEIHAATLRMVLAAAGDRPGPIAQSISDEEKLRIAGLFLSGATVRGVSALLDFVNTGFRTLPPGPYAFPVRRSTDCVVENSTGTATNDIIIPVYQGVAETVQCLQSVLMARCRTPHEIVCILDDPAGVEMRRTLQAFADAGRITIIVNERNLGFVQSVNRGMRLHPGRDVVLLNSDTIVHHDWLDRIVAAAQRAPEIGTLTPFSNNATICSYPRFAEDNPLPSHSSGAELDAACHSANSGNIVDIPTGVGFCMYIRRQCLDDVGYFNEEAFGRGYGEENDFCRRAVQRGWRNVILTDTFVDHLGSVSFAGSKNSLAAQNLKTLLSMHPTYQSVIEAFVASDPLRPWRRRIDVARLSRVRGPFFCIISHEFGGGTQIYAETLARALEDAGIHVLFIRCSGNGRVRIATTAASGIENLVYDLPAENAQLTGDLLRLGVTHFHFQSNINIPEALFSLPAQCGAPYDCTVHDYSWICPRVHLVDASRVYCNEPEERACNHCISTSGRHPQWALAGPWHVSISEFRHHSAGVLSGARRVFCPSADVMLRLQRTMDLPNACVRPHPEPYALPDWRAPRLAPGEVLRIAVLGAIGPEKGSEVLRRCAYDAFKHNLPLQFIVIGYTDCDPAFRELPNVLITGAYQPGGLTGLLENHKPHISFFAGVLPETFSYTLSIAFHCGLFPVAFDIGSIAERIRSAGYGALLPLEHCWIPRTVNTALMENAARAATTPPPSVPVVLYPDILADYYGFAAGQFAAEAAGR